MKAVEIAANAAEILWPKQKNQRYVRDWWAQQGWDLPQFDWGLVHQNWLPNL